MDLIPRSGRCPGEGNGNPVQYSCLGNPMERGAWRATVHGVAKSQTVPSDYIYLCMCVDLSLNLAIRSSWSEPRSAPGLVFADCIELLHLWLQRI